MLAHSPRTKPVTHPPRTAGARLDLEHALLPTRFLSALHHKPKCENGQSQVMHPCQILLCLEFIPAQFRFCVLDCTLNEAKYRWHFSHASRFSGVLGEALLIEYEHLPLLSSLHGTPRSLHRSHRSRLPRKSHWYKPEECPPGTYPPFLAARCTVAQRQRSSPPSYLSRSHPESEHHRYLYIKNK